MTARLASIYLKVSGQVSRLELHRKQVDEKGGMCELLLLDQLSPLEKGLVTASFLAEVKRLNHDLYPAYAATLAQWGIMCEHPLATRQYKSFKYFHCSACGCVCPEAFAPVEALV